jgi:hypothetical protein
MKHEKVSERMVRRDLRLKNDAYTPVGHVVLELDRLARQVKRLEQYTPESGNVFVYFDDVLKLIQRAKK